jgi:hypothetical protein
VLSGAGIALMGLFGLGLGAVVRHSAAALATYVGVVFVVGQLLLAVAPAAVRWVPLAIVSDSLGVSRTASGDLSPWAGLAVLCGYATVALGAGAWTLARRDG